MRVVGQLASRILGEKESAVAPAAGSDVELLARAGEGDGVACKELLDRHGQRLFAIIETAHGDLSASEDVVQETFIRAIQQRRQLRSAESLFPWIVRIGLRVAIDIRRKTKRERLTAETPELSELPEAGPHERYRAAEDAAAVKRALRELKPYPRELLVLRYFSSFSVTELSAVFEKSEVAIRKDLQRAREAMKEELGDWFAA